MSQRELIFVLAHAQLCTACRERLLTSPQDALVGRWLTADEKSLVVGLKDTDFYTPERLAEATGVSVCSAQRKQQPPGGAPATSVTGYWKLVTRRSIKLPAC